MPPAGSIPVAPTNIPRRVTASTRGASSQFATSDRVRGEGSCRAKRAGTPGGFYTDPPRKHRLVPAGKPRSPEGEGVPPAGSIPVAPTTRSRTPPPMHAQGGLRSSPPGRRPRRPKSAHGHGPPPRAQRWFDSSPSRPVAREAGVTSAEPARHEQGGRPPPRRVTASTRGASSQFATSDRVRGGGFLSSKASRNPGGFEPGAPPAAQERPSQRRPLKDRLHRSAARALDVIAEWSAEYGAANGRTTPPSPARPKLVR